jgi:transcriptional regulator of NAD metabolism
MEKFKSGKSNLLMDVTSGYHYHTVQADSEALLDIIQERLEMKGFLAKLQDHEPVKFW